MSYEGPQEFKINKIGSYKGHDVYASDFVSKESVGMMHNSGSIMIRTEAYKILQSKPEFLKRIFEHEITMGAGHDPHGIDEETREVLQYLKDNGYDFGDFIF
ncbi:hypothetical protein KKG46_01505 [Patescibacteria group bacterium]|nr:hypothetical protein [Patescibacteria group bacterium]